MIILRLHSRDAAALAPHRTRAGWQLCGDGESLWLQCPDHAETECAALPCTERYHADNQGRLRLPGGTLPVAKTPAGPWLPLTEALPLQPGPPALPGRTREPLTISLVRSERAVTAGGMLLPLESLVPWVEKAPRLRLQRLQFAARADGQTFVRGTPLPPVAGVSFYMKGALALPCGWDFAPHVWSGWVEKALAVPAGALAVVHENATIELIGAEGFVPLTLGALRRTLQEAAS